jgi:hypothetical protein
MADDTRSGPDLDPVPQLAGRWPDGARQRLHATLLDAYRRLCTLGQRLGKEAAQHPDYQAARRCYVQAVTHAQAKRAYVAWDCLHQFDDSMIGAMTDEERAECWNSLRAEAGAKLRGWRAHAAARYLRRDPPTKSPTVAEARELHALLAASSQNLQLRLATFETRTVPVLACVLIAVVLAALAVACYVLREHAALATWATPLLLAIGAGGLGGVLSMTFTLGKVDLAQRIPAVHLQFLTTLIRPLLGAVAAIPVMVLVKSQWVAVAGLKGSLAVFVGCFLAGFSERWFLGLMDRMDGAGKEASDKAATGTPSPRPQP